MSELIASNRAGTEHYFQEQLQQRGLNPLTRDNLQELQINLGYRCNQACTHCHVEAGPNRTEEMSWDTMLKVLGWLDRSSIRQVDLTGGAPEMNPHFRRFCTQLRRKNIGVTARSNLTILTEPGYETYPAWYAEQKIRVTASLPCYTPDNVDQQRGRGVFGKSIQALQQLNAQGYGQDSQLPLTLVFNPNGATLPPDQATLEAEYKQRLKDDFGICFTNLLTITNLPIKRFRHSLERAGELADYFQLLGDNFNPATLPGLMCRSLLSMDWQGRVFDCDFNQMLQLPLANRASRYLWELDPGTLKNTPIAVNDHCLGCTAGAGSSCSGALT